MSQTCYIGFKFGEHAGHSIRMNASSKRKSFTKLYGVFCICRQLIWSHLQLLQHKEIKYICGSHLYIDDQSELLFEWYGNRCTHRRRCKQDHYSTITKSDTCVHERRIFSSATCALDKNKFIIRMKRKTGLVGKKILRHSFLLQCTCSVAHSLRALRWLAVNKTPYI